MPRHKSADFKVACVNHYRNISHSRDATCRALGCSSRSLARWIERFQDKGDVPRHNREPRAYKMTQAQVDEAIDFLAEHQTASIPELHTHLEETFDDYDITVDHLGRVVRDNNLTRKRTKHGHYPRVRRG